MDDNLRRRLARDTDQIFYIYWQREDEIENINYQVLWYAANELLPDDIEHHAIDTYEGQVIMLADGEDHESEYYYGTFLVHDYDTDWSVDIIIMGSKNPNLGVKDPFLFIKTDMDINKIADTMDDDDDEFGGTRSFSIEYDF